MRPIESIEWNVEKSASAGRTLFFWRCPIGVSLPRLSMGMSNDYRIAVEEGATWIRLGTVLFGARPKVKPMRPVDAGDAGESGEGGGAYDRVMD